MPKKTLNKDSDDYGLTHPQRILYPKSGITKFDIAKYYDEVQDWILPYVINRPLTLVRCPQGSYKDCFYQKHFAKESAPPGFHFIKIKEKLKSDFYIYITDFSGLLGLVQLGVLEIHIWGCKIDQLEKPDMIIFDLDPALDIAWTKIINTAFLIEEQLEKSKLKSFVKTTGGKGLHIVVPFKRHDDWDEIKDISQRFAEQLVELNPNAYIASMSKKKRVGKIFIDYLRNQRGATAVAPYSTRAKEHATVSVPLSWEELSSRIKPDTFNIDNLPKRLHNLKTDPWKDFLKTKQTLKLKVMLS